MHRDARVRRWKVAGLVVLIALVAGLIGGPDAEGRRRRRKKRKPPARICQTLPEIRIAQPLNAPDVLDVARIAGSVPSDPDEWEMVFDAWWCNPTSSTYEISMVSTKHLDAQNAVIRTRSIVPGGDNVVSPGPTGEPGITHVRDLGEEGQFPFPLPAAVAVSFVLSETVDGSGPPEVVVEKTYKVSEHVSPGGGYRLPFKQADLPDGAYWSHGRHGSNNAQRWAYDLGVDRWMGSGWSPLRDGGSFRNAADFWTWDVPLYAVADGEIIGCSRGANDNLRTVHEGGPPAAGNIPGGNLIWLRSGDETIVYAHLKKDSIPFELCPFTDDAEHALADPSANPPSDAPYRVRAGQFLGRVGNSGNSTSHTHLHIHAMRGLPRIAGGSEFGIDADGRPLQFVGASVQPLDRTNVSAVLWNPLEVPAQLAYFSRISDAP